MNRVGVTWASYKAKCEELEKSKQREEKLRELLSDKNKRRYNEDFLTWTPENDLWNGWWIPRKQGEQCLKELGE